jgi:hypothetical protein
MLQESAVANLRCIPHASEIMRTAWEILDKGSLNDEFLLSFFLSQSINQNSHSNQIHTLSTFSILTATLKGNNITLALTNLAMATVQAPSPFRKLEMEMGSLTYIRVSSIIHQTSDLTSPTDGCIHVLVLNLFHRVIDPFTERECKDR